MRVRQFRPALIPTLATAVAFPLLLALGFWQLDRAEQKEAAQALFEAGAAASPLNLNLEAVDPDQALFRAALVVGEWDDQQHLLLDNQTYRSAVGYHVLTPLRFETESGSAAILVDRGWVEGDPNRSQLPVVNGLAEVGERWSDWVNVYGYLDFGPATGIQLGGMAEGEQGWPLRIQRLDYEALTTRLGYAVLPMVLRLDPALPNGFVREWRPAKPLGFGPERNRGYAVQWFGLAAALLVIFLTVNLKREDKNPS